jgi:hypothetical protein
LLIVILLLTIIVMLAGRLNPEVLQDLEDADQDPEVTPGLFQGDMALTDEVTELL